MNVVVLTGRLTRDPEKVTASIPVVRYTLAVDRQGKKGEADFIECRAFNKSAEFALQYFKKGMRVGVEGCLNVSAYKPKPREHRTSTTVFINSQESLESKKETVSLQPDKAEINEGFEPADDIELPFV